MRIEKIFIPVIALAVGIALKQPVQKSQEDISFVTLENVRKTETRKNYTVMFYMIGSTVRQGEENEKKYAKAANDDLWEIVTAMKTFELEETVNAVAEIGGTNFWEDKALKGVSNARIALNSRGIEVLERMPDTNMGDSRTVTEFINYASENYPAEHYLLIFWNHGGGPAKGFGYDMLHDGDNLTLKELNQAIAESNIGQFDLIGFDACNMGNIETVNALARYTAYMVAAPGCEDISGWNYAWIGALKKEGVSMDAIGEEIVNTYKDYNKRNKTTYEIPVLSCYSIADYYRLYDSIARLNEQLNGGEQEAFFEKISKSKSHMKGYHKANGLDRGMDLLDIAVLYKTLDAEGWEDYGLQEQLDKTICHTTLDKDGSENCGLGIYFPEYDYDSLVPTINLYQDCLFDKNYINFVTCYARYLDSDLDLELEEIQYESADREIVFSVQKDWQDEITSSYVMTLSSLENMQLTDEIASDSNAEYGREQGHILLATDSGILKDGERWTAELDKEYFSIAGELICTIEDCSSESGTVFLCPILYNNEICEMAIEVSEQYPNGKISSIIPALQKGMPQKDMYVLEEGVTFAALYPFCPIGDSESKKWETQNQRYIRGNKVVLAKGDTELKWKSVEQNLYSYQLVLIDKKMRCHYTEIID